MSSEARFLVGIDLGTTNSAVAFAELGVDREPRSWPIAQLVAPGEMGERSSLPSALYLAGDHEVAAGALALPWRGDEREVVGVLARKLGERVAGRLLVSVKSWLCHPGVDRRASILPWGAPDGVPRLSPIAASARILRHVAGAWDQRHPDAPLARQEIVLTVPASFDEVARELTVAAAAGAGLCHVRLLEEPLAAAYAWLAVRRDRWRADLGDRKLVLVVDVGGGTTDFSLISVRRGAEGLALERVAVGEHLLLGGDNIDLALARLVESRHRGQAALDASRWQQLTALCREAKERLLADDAPESVAIALPGKGRGVISTALSARLDRADVIATALDGFFPHVPSDARPRRNEAIGLAEFGLPFEGEAEITRHLAAFLARHAAATEPLPESSAPGETAGSVPEPICPTGGSALAPVDAVLFNGGALTPALVRSRLLDVLESWFGSRPRELEGADLELAVARGAVASGLARRGVGVRVAGGAPRSYYLAVATMSDGEACDLLCVAPRGMSEGETVSISGRDLELVANAPVRFPIFASTSRPQDRGGDLVRVERESLESLPEISTVLRFGRALAERVIPVRLEATLSEIGTLELYCCSQGTGHRWRLEFDLRGRPPGAPSGGELAAVAGSGTEEGTEEVKAPALVIDDEALACARQRIADCFVAETIEPASLARELETALDAGRDAWPLEVIRSLWDELFERREDRVKSPALEARWLNLSGYLLRPGFGDARDAWRGEQLWRLFDRGLVHSGATQVRAEWWTMWKRAAGALKRPQQQQLLQEIRPHLLPALAKKAKASRWRGGPQEVREMWQVAASLERVPAAAKRELGSELIARILRDRAGDAEIWAFGRLAARAPSYGPADTVVEARVVQGWVESLVEREWSRAAAVGLAVASAARRTGDRARDLDDACRDLVALRLEREGEAGRGLAPLVREVVSLSVRQQAQMFSESMPVGLRVREPGLAASGEEPAK